MTSINASIQNISDFSSKFCFSYPIFKSLLEPLRSLRDLTIHADNCKRVELGLTIFPGVFDTAISEVVVKGSLQLTFSEDYLKKIRDHTVKIYSSIRDKDDRLMSHQSHGTFCISEKKNPLHVVSILCSQKEGKMCDGGTISISIEVEHNSSSLASFEKW